MTEAGFHTVWIPLQERFYRVAFYILEDRADALDAVQDLYMKLWKIRDSLDLVRNPGAYGALLMRNLCIDRIRKLNPSDELPDDLPGKEPPDEELIRNAAKRQSRCREECLTFTETGMVKQVCRGWAIAKSRTRVSEISSSS